MPRSRTAPESTESSCSPGSSLAAFAAPPSWAMAAPRGRRNAAARCSPAADGFDPQHRALRGRTALRKLPRVAAACAAHTAHDILAAQPHPRALIVCWFGHSSGRVPCKRARNGIRTPTAAAGTDARGVQRTTPQTRPSHVFLPKRPGGATKGGPGRWYTFQTQRGSSAFPAGTPHGAQRDPATAQPSLRSCPRLVESGRHTIRNLTGPACGSTQFRSRPRPTRDFEVLNVGMNPRHHSRHPVAAMLSVRHRCFIEFAAAIFSQRSDLIYVCRCTPLRSRHG